MSSLELYFRCQLGTTMLAGSKCRPSISASLAFITPHLYSCSKYISIHGHSQIRLAICTMFPCSVTFPLHTRAIGLLNLSPSAQDSSITGVKSP